LRSISPQMKGPVFRLPSGGGSGYGPTHSQSPERTFLSYDNIQILSLSVWADPKEILTHAINDNKCSILVEPKVLYSKKIPVDIPAGFTLFKSHEKYSTFWLRPDGPEAEVTLIAYGFGAVKAVEAISEIISKNDIIPELFILTKVSQLENFAAFKHFEGKKLLLIDDGPKNYGVMAHFAALLSQNKELPRQITLLGTKSSMIPAATDLEEKILVSVGDILQSCREME
jgi:2-oxoisovalerate dehydrogenase E1 component